MSSYLLYRNYSNVIYFQFGCQKWINTEMIHGNTLTNVQRQKIKTQQCTANLLGQWPRQCGRPQTRHASSLIRSSAEQNGAVAASCCLLTIFSYFLLCYTPTCDPPIHSFSPSCSRLTVTVSSPLITVPLSYNCRSKKLSSCLSLGSTLGGKLQHYIKTMTRVGLRVRAHAELCLHLFVCIPLHEVKRLLQNVNNDRESGLHVNNSRNNTDIYNPGHLFSRSSIYILRIILFFIVFYFLRLYLHISITCLVNS